MKIRLVYCSYLPLFCSFFATTALAQTVSFPTAPLPGRGHDYVTFLSETVDPSSGTVSLNVPIPVRPGRGITMPLNPTYGLTPSYQLVVSEDGASISIQQAPYPALGLATWQESTFDIPVYSNTGMAEAPQICNKINGFTFTGIDGVTHSLSISGVATSSASNGSCGGTGVGGGGDQEVNAAISNPTTTTNDMTGWSGDGGSIHPYHGPIGKFVVNDKNGTTYFFDGADNYNSTYGKWVAAAYLIEDRNGNEITVCSSGYCDTLGKPVGAGIDYSLSSTGTATINYTVPNTLQQVVDGGQTVQCAYSANWNVSGSVPGEVDVSVGTPTDQVYKLYYGSENPNDSSVTNPYGLLNEIVYPSGGWVKYSYPSTLSNAYNQMSSLTGSLDGNAAVDGCAYLYTMPQVTKRTVSFDGSSIADTQTFSYSTTYPGGGNTWTAKSTNQTDNIGSASYLKVYSYAPGVVPLEQTIKHYAGSSTSTALLKTETKGWLDQYHLACDITTFSNGSTGHFYTYDTTHNYNLSDDKQYDFGIITSPSSICNNNGGVSTATAPSGPTRETKTTAFQRFINPILAVFSAPTTTVVYDHGTSVAQTDYTYDQSPLVTVSATSHDDTNFGAANTTNRGNPTTITHECIGCTSATTTYTYDETGQIASMTDPCGNATCSDMSGTTHTTTYSFADSPSQSSNTNAYLTKATDPLGHYMSYQYDYTSGQLIQTKDQNQQTTNYCYTTGGCNGSGIDPLLRVTGISYPDGGSKIISYSDTAPSPSVTTQTALNSSTTMTTKSILDGMGHVVTTESDSDPGGVVDVKTQYDGMGRVSTISNPYRPSTDTEYVTTTTYDALGRKATQTYPDANAVQWCYNGVVSAGQTHCLTNGSSLTANSWIDFIDENGNQWQRSYDGLGRLGSVLEPSATVQAPSLETDYSYNALDNLTRVDQWGTSAHTGTGDRVRLFSYDSLSRLLASSNPENASAASPAALTCPGVSSGAWSTCYAYDANGNLVSKTDNRSRTTTSHYDVLNRLTAKTYSDSTPPAHFAYDQNSVTVGSTTPTLANTTGRLTSEYSGAATPYIDMKAFSYDLAGRPQYSYECWGAECSMTNGTRTMQRNYDLAGNTIFQDSGTGQTYTYTTNSVGQVYTVKTTVTTAQPPLTSTLSASALYTAWGALSTRNGMESWAYDTRLRLTSHVTVHGATTEFSQSLTYQPNGNLKSSAEVAGTHSSSWSYTYDDLNRLSTALSSGLTPSEGCQETYDNWGNRTAQAGAAGGYLCTSVSPTANTNNQLSTLAYDAAGNTINDGTNNYTYDAEDRITAVAAGGSPVATYTYGPDGQRATKTVGSTTTYYSYDFDGALIARYESGTGITGVVPYNQEVWLNGQHLGTVPGVTNAFSRASVDQIGSERVELDPSGNIYGSMYYLPFGEGPQVIQGTPKTTTLFTGKERDAESGNDYFGARYYGSSMGRFMSPDPSGAAFSDPGNPQSWNMYSYVQNNPLNSVDPDGLDCVYIGSDGSLSGFNSGDCDNSTTEKANSGYYFDGTVSTIYTTTGDASGQVVGVQGTTDDGTNLYQANPAGTSFAQPNGNSSTSGMDTIINTWGNYSQTTQFNHGTHPFRDNNPGDMMTAGGFSGRHGAIGSDGRVAVFPGVGTGRSALDSLLHTPNYQSMTVSGALAVFAPPNENNTAAYQQFIQNVVGVSGNAPLSSLSPSQMNALENGIARYEGFNAAGNYSVSVTINF